MALHVYQKHNYLLIDNDHAIINLWVRKFTSKFYLRLQTNGPVWTLSRYKQIYDWFKAYIFKVDNYQTLINPFTKTNKQGIPKELHDISHLIHQDSIWLRVIMTVLRLFESIKLKPKFDESSITGSYIGKPIQPILLDFKSFLDLWFHKFGKQIRGKLILSKLTCHELSFRFKSGPMGPSILTSHLCAIAIQLNEEFRSIFWSYASMTVTSDIRRQFQFAVDLCTNVETTEKLIMGKISLASEPAGKTRLFAICNFWVQSILKPLHNALMETLKLFVSDGTFDQIGQFNRIRKETKGKTTYCFDLTKATDRFPIKLQQLLLGVIVNEEFATCWVQLISYFPFSYNNKSYYWSVGQPLGAFSSWAMFALTHHLVVQYCYFKVTKKLRWFNQYALLGDDIVIWHTKVAEFYQQFMYDIGVEINLTKSFIGLTNSGEFAKRHFLNGHNISGFGYAMIKRANASLTGWIRFLEILESEDFLSTGATLLLPGNNDKALARSTESKVAWLYTLRKSFAHKLFLAYGNIIFSYSDLMEHYVLQRIELLNKQATSSLEYKQFLKLSRKIILLSQRRGVAVKLSCLDISFVGDELVSHPLVRYLNVRNNLIWDKIEQFNIVIQDSLFSQDSILELCSYSQEEYIPSLNLDTFFTEDVNELKHKVKTSVQYKAIKSLMNANKDYM